MNQEYIGRASSVELAKEDALNQAKEALGGAEYTTAFEILEEPKTGFFGLVKKGDAVVKLTACIAEPEVKEEEISRRETAAQYLDDILAAMGLNDISYTVTEEEGDNVTFTFEGEDIGVLIGHHGETLDALQYLVGLASNRRKEGTYCRITLDGGSYREKRAETLQELARKIGEKVKRTGRSQMLEPMNPYERRIIHAVVSEIPGIYSKSKGEDPNRRVIIISENPRPNNYNKRGGSRRGPQNGDYRGQRSGGYTRSRSNKPTIEQMLKEDKDYVNRTTKQKNDDQLDAKLFSKIELD